MHLHPKNWSAKAALSPVGHLHGRAASRDWRWQSSRSCLCLKQGAERPRLRRTVASRFRSSTATRREQNTHLPAGQHLGSNLTLACHVQGKRHAAQTQALPPPQPLHTQNWPLSPAAPSQTLAVSQRRQPPWGRNSFQGAALVSCAPGPLHASQCMATPPEQQDLMVPHTRYRLFCSLASSRT